MTQEEIIKRNEAIDKMLGTLINLKGYKPFNYREDYLRLMPAYEHVQSLGNYGRIYKKNSSAFVSELFDKDGSEMCYNEEEDLRTAIWLTVSDFAMDFNKKSNGN